MHTLNKNIRYIDIKDCFADMHNCTSSQSIFKAGLDPATLQPEGCLSNLKATADPIIKQRSNCILEMI